MGERETKKLGSQESKGKTKPNIVLKLIQAHTKSQIKAHFKNRTTFLYIEQILQAKLSPIPYEKHNIYTHTDDTTIFFNSCEY